MKGKINISLDTSSGMKKTITFIFLLIVMGLVSSLALTSIPPVKQGQCVSLPQSEFGSAYENISGIQLPDKTVVSKNVKMTYSNGLYNYSFCDTTQLGTYVVNGFSDLSTWAYDFDVSASGQGALGNNSIALVIILIVFAGLFALMGYSIDSNKWLIKLSMYFVALVVMLINIGLGMQLTNSTNVNSLMSTALIIGVAAFALFIGYILVAYTINVVRSVKNARNAKKDDLD